MKRLVYISILLFSFSSFGQPKARAVTDQEVCESGKQRAQKRLALGQICFPRYIFESTVTLRKTLEFDYGILDVLYDTLYDIGDHSELVCHDEIMKKVIEAKWGANFLEDQREIANNLDKHNLGFKEPHNENIEGAIRTYLEKNLRAQGTSDNSIELMMLFTISPKGQVTKLKVAKAGQGLLSKDDPTYVAIVKGCEGFMDNWAPATINSIPKPGAKYLMMTIKNN